MSLKQESDNAVELANTDRVNELVGVIGENSLLEFTSDDKEVKVVTSGVASVLVSDLNGEIKAGDKVTASPIDGVGMKASDSAQIVGTAQVDFDPGNAASRTITDKEGKSQTVRIGLVAAQINVTYFVPQDDTSFLPSFLQNFANSIGGREVSPVRVIVSAILLLIGLISIAVLLYSSVHSSIISIGRNPLSERAVNKSLLEVGLVTIGILLVTLIAVYLILRM